MRKSPLIKSHQQTIISISKQIEEKDLVVEIQEEWVVDQTKKQSGKDRLDLITCKNTKYGAIVFMNDKLMEVSRTRNRKQRKLK